nr:RNA-dependent RNA polymerase 6 [Tanacetum cinerariifolium]
MDPNSSLGKIFLGENVVKILSDKVEGFGDWNSPKFQDTANSGQMKKMKAMVFHQIDTEKNVFGESVPIEGTPICVTRSSAILLRVPIEGIPVLLLDSSKLSLRPSMNKFESEHTVLEICSWTRLKPGFQNRQIITSLSELGVKDEIFLDMQLKMVTNLDQMLVDTDVAFDVITASCVESGNTMSIMLVAGFKPRTGPYLHGMLNNIQAAQLKDLCEKAWIFVHDG